MITLVPPHADPSLELRTDDEVVDVNQLFLAELLDTDPPAADRAAALLLTAGRAALRDVEAGLTHRLLGLGAVLTGLAAPDHGVRLRLDDLELASGSTQRSDDVLRAATAPAPYDHSLDAAITIADGHRAVTLVVERDQQLPAALRAARRLGGQDRALRVTGRYATACWPVLRSLPDLAGAELEPAPRGLRWRLRHPFGLAGLPALPWRERAGDPRPAGTWAGRVALRDLSEVDGAHTVILGLCAVADRAVGRGGSTLAWPELRAVVRRLRDEGVQVLAEMWLGAPGSDRDQAPAALRAIEDIVDRVAGLRIFDWPVGWTEPRWAGRPVPVESTGDDLARHARLPDQPPATELVELVRALGRGLARTGSLVPGRIAAAYLAPAPRPVTDGPLLDPDVVLGARSARSGKAIAVNLRTGACTAVERPVSDLIVERAPASLVRAALSGVPEPSLLALRDGDVLWGVS